MINLQIQNMYFNPGKTLWVKGAFTSNPKSFKVKVGKDPENIAMHFCAYFNDEGKNHVISMNTKINGMWGEEVETKKFPFQKEKDFEMTFTFSSEGFQFDGPDNLTLHLPNKLGDIGYNNIWIEGDIFVKAINVK